MSHSATNFVRVYRAANSMEAHLIKGMLEGYDMRVRLFGDGLSSAIGELPTDVIQVEIQVQKSFELLARQLIEEYESRSQSKSPDSVDWTCPACHEVNPENFDVCWSCQRRSNAPDTTIR